MIYKKLLIFSFIIFFVSNCAKKDPVSGEDIRLEPSVDKRASEVRDKGGGIFGTIGSGSKSNTFDFASSNILWRATLKTLDFLPMANADYSGGVIVYDWYSDELNSNEQIKISIQFLNNEIRSDSLQINAHKKNCLKDERCKITKVTSNFSDEIKNNILTEARRLKIEEAKKNLK